MRFVSRGRLFLDSQDALNRGLGLDSMVAILSDRFKTCSDVAREEFKESSVRLTDNYLSYRCLRVEVQEKQPLDAEEKVKVVPVKDIIGCQVLRHQSMARFRGESEAESEARKRTAYICVYAYPFRSRGRLGVARQLKRIRKTLVLGVDKFGTWADNFAVAETWRRAILWLIRQKSVLLSSTSLQIPETSPKTRNLLILINPASGPGKALQIFDQRVSPLLVESGTRFEVLTTKAANSALNYIKSCPDLTNKWDGIVVVSGDGLLYEVFNGLMQRRDWQEAIKLPVGIVPGGSGNGLAHSVNFANGELASNPILSSALNIVSGKHSPMDLVRVSTLNKTMYSFLSLGWGLISDIDIESERLRMVGGARFTIWAVVRTMGLRKYKGRLSYLPLPGYVKRTPPTSQKIFRRHDISRSKTVIGCSSSEDVKDSSLGRYRSLTDKLPNNRSQGDEDLWSNGSNGVTSFLDSNNARIGQTKIDRVHSVPDLDVGSISSVISLEPPQSVFPAMSGPVPDDWEQIEGDFILVYSCYQTHISSDCFFAPQAKLDDGVIWLLFITGEVTRTQILQFLISLDSGNHVDLPFVTMVPVRVFRLEPLNKEGRVTVDGELIDCGPVQAEIMPSIAKVMSR